MNQCLDCHSYSPGYVTEINGFGLLIHGLHDDRNAAFSQMGGDCWSCHAATNDGEGMALWDQVKHEKLRGILDVAEATGEFTWNQDKTVRRGLFLRLAVCSRGLRALRQRDGGRGTRPVGL